MEEKYRNQMNQVHAPKELIERTKRNIRKKKRMSILTTSFVAAAMLVCGIAIGIAYRSQMTRIHIYPVQFETRIELGLSLGVISVEDKKEESNIVEKKSEKEKARKIMEEIPASTIKGNEVYIGFDEKKEIYYAVYEKEGNLYMIEEKEMSEKEFVELLKNKF